MTFCAAGIWTLTNPGSLPSLIPHAYGICVRARARLTDHVTCKSQVESQVSDLSQNSYPSISGGSPQNLPSAPSDDRLGLSPLLTSFVPIGTSLTCPSEIDRPTHKSDPAAKSPEITLSPNVIRKATRQLGTVLSW